MVNQQFLFLNKLLWHILVSVWHLFPNWGLYFKTWQKLCAFWCSTTSLHICSFENTSKNLVYVTCKHILISKAKLQMPSVAISPHSFRTICWFVRYWDLTMNYFAFTSLKYNMCLHQSKVLSVQTVKRGLSLNSQMCHWLRRSNFLLSAVFMLCHTPPSHGRRTAEWCLSQGY